jgi:hypothetical protein
LCVWKWDELHDEQKTTTTNKYKTWKKKNENLKAEKIKTYPYVVDRQQLELVGQLQEDQHVVEHHRQLIMMNHCKRNEMMIEK